MRSVEDFMILDPVPLVNVMITQLIRLFSVLDLPPSVLTSYTGLG